jgi:hypothetical protein
VDDFLVHSSHGLVRSSYSAEVRPPRLMRTHRHADARAAEARGLAPFSRG